MGPWFERYFPLAFMYEVTGNNRRSNVVHRVHRAAFHIFFHNHWTQRTKDNALNNGNEGLVF